MVYMYPCAWSCDSIYEIKLGYHLNCISTSTACTTLDCISVLANLQSMTNSNAHSTQRFLPVPSCLSLSLSSPPSFLFSLLPLFSDPLGGRHNPAYEVVPSRDHSKHHNLSAVTTLINTLTQKIAPRTIGVFSRLFMTQTRSSLPTPLW